MTEEYEKNDEHKVVIVIKKKEKEIKEQFCNKTLVNSG